MKKIEAIFKPYKLDEVRGALSVLGVDALTVSEVKSCGRSAGLSETQRGRGFNPDLHSNIKVEVLVPDSLSGTVAAAIIEAARTGSKGDGQVLIHQVEEAIRIRPEEAKQLAPR